MRLDKDFCRDFEKSSRMEWMVTNGRGGFASGTVSGVPTRRYHGLLVAPLRPPQERMTTLFGLSETLRCPDATAIEFSANAYPGLIHPRGYLFLEEFTDAPYPTWTFQLPDGSRIEKTVAMIRGENSVILRYRLVAGPGGELRLRPRLVWRDYHHLQRANDSLAKGVEIRAGRIAFQPHSYIPPLVILHTARQISSEAWWFWQNEYRVERERGLDFLEDQWSPCEFVADLSPENPTVTLLATLESARAQGRISDADLFLDNEESHREELAASVRVAEGVPPDIADALTEWAVRAEDFLVTRFDGRWTVIAGYPWFTDWGRDTMISLPGLTLARGRLDVAKDMLSGFAAYCDGGMIPNRFPDWGEKPEYNTADATLWFVEAVRRYAELAPDDPILREEWYPLLRGILDAHLAGTRYGIHTDADGLLSAGEVGTQLTWMDAKVGDWVVTPRMGKPVEINALWYNTLRTVEAFARTFGDPATEDNCRQHAEKARQAFRERFVNPFVGGLYDVVDGPDGTDPSIRPNQIFAVSLHHRMLDNAMERAIVEVVDAYLYTPVGLRSLASNHVQYHPVYGGDVWSRDGAYHQGTVWGWLWGAYVTAYGNAFGRNERFKARLSEWFRLLLTQRDALASGGIAEIYDGRAPHRANGCPWQAWSVAEVLRVAWEEGLLERSPNNS